MDKDKLIKKINDFFLELGMSTETIANGMWVIRDEFENIENIVVSLEEPIVIFRVKLMKIPTTNREQFYEKLLTMNASSLVHGAYAIENGNVVIVDTLQSENLDLNEFQASIESLSLAIAQDYKQLSQYLNK
ncbi:MAG: YbjN domain-containing protein [Spirochaetota bacterium]|nr:YbjN domain-containing protein [Spirochaetota bacterium]